MNGQHKGGYVKPTLWIEDASWMEGVANYLVLRIEALLLSDLVAVEESKLAGISAL